jgi:hypothetical protein
VPVVRHAAGPAKAVAGLFRRSGRSWMTGALPAGGPLTCASQAEAAARTERNERSEAKRSRGLGDRPVAAARSARQGRFEDVEKEDVEKVVRPRASDWLFCLGRCLTESGRS